MKRKNYERKDSAGAIVPILRKLAGARRVNAYFMRKTTANLVERLTEQEQDAMMEIALAHKIICGSYGMRQWRYENSGKSPERDFSNFALDMLKRFRLWSRAMVDEHPDALGICLEICTNEESVAQMSKWRKQRWESTLTMFKKGLGEWEKISGR